MRSASEIQVRDSVDHLFRHHAGQMVSVLSRIFGFDRIDMIEDAVQDALIAALKTWPFAGTPDNPTAWLTQVAKNRVLDRIRRDGRSVEAGDEGESVADPAGGKEIFFASEIHEDELRMMFACCHPSITPDSQVAVTLKIIGGFSISEIARAYLANDDAIAKMLTRAKKKLRESGAAPEIPPPAKLGPRVASVLKVLYLMFNEGYTASGGDELVRKDLCFEAIRLCRILAEHPRTGEPKVHALLALFLFQGARLSSRSDHRGELLLLDEQDRTLWDREMISSGLHYFRLSARGNEVSDCHLEAEIAAAHALASSYESTDWQNIFELYETLQSRHFSVVAELNRIVVLEKLRGAARALKALQDLEGGHDVGGLNLFYITKAHFLSKLGQTGAALAAYKRALELTVNQPVRRFVSNRVRALSVQASEFL